MPQAPKPDDSAPVRLLRYGRVKEALAAIRHLDRESFDASAKALLAANPEVRTMSGCKVGHEKAEAVVKRIAGGLYDGWAGKTEVTSERR